HEHLVEIETDAGSRHPGCDATERLRMAYPVNPLIMIGTSVPPRIPFECIGNSFARVGARNAERLATHLTHGPRQQALDDLRSDQRIELDPAISFVMLNLVFCYCPDTVRFTVQHRTPPEPPSCKACFRALHPQRVCGALAISPRE